MRIEVLAEVHAWKGKPVRIGPKQLKNELDYKSCMAYVYVYEEHKHNIETLM